MHHLKTGVFLDGHCGYQTGKIWFVGGHHLCSGTVLDPFLTHLEVAKNNYSLSLLQGTSNKKEDWEDQVKTKQGRKGSKQKGHKPNLFLLPCAAALKH